MTFECAQQQCFKTVRPRQALLPYSLRYDSFRKVVGSLEILPFPYGELPVRPEGRGDTLCDLEIPPAPTSASLHILGAQRSFIANASPKFPRNLRVFADKIPPPGVMPELASSEFKRRIELHGNPARFVSPVLEHRLARFEKLLAERRIETLQSRKENNRVASRTRDRNRVELQVSEAPHDRHRGLPSLLSTSLRPSGKSGPLRFHEAGPGEGKPPGFPYGQRFHG